MSNWKLPQWQQRITVNGTTYTASTGGVFAVAAAYDAEMLNQGAISDGGTGTEADVRIAASANATIIAAQAAAGLPTSTTTLLSDKANAINTAGKSKGKLVYNTTTDLLVYAIGTSDTSKWRLAGAVDATGDITPS